MNFKRRDIYLKIEALSAYSPLAPIICARHYGRDCMLNPGHELGRVSPAEIFEASLDALVYREYLDPHFLVPNKAKLVSPDVNEPPWDRRVPGAVLYAKPGERLFIHVLNGDKEDCHSFHLHGLKYGIDSDGAWPLGVRTRDGRRSDEILPGQMWTYVFDATAETIGAWAFHDHVRNVQRNVNRGLFGGLVVRDPSAPCADHEVPMFVHQMAGVSALCEFQSPTLSTGQTFSFTFGQTTGVCRYHCLIHGVTMAGQVQVVAGGPMTAAVDIGDNFFSPASVNIAPGGMVTWTHKGKSNHIVFASGGGSSTYCLNGRAYVGNTPTIAAESGQSLRWYLFNLDLGTVWHNFHPHSSRWQLPVPPGGASDVHSLSPVETFVANTIVPPAFRLPCVLEELQCDPPADACRVRLKGDFLFHCHIEEHMMQGLAGLIRAKEYVWLTEAVAKQLHVELPYDDGLNGCPEADLLRCNPRRYRPPSGLQVDLPMSGMERGPMSGMGNMPMDVMSNAPINLSKAATEGIWELLPCDSQVLAVHAALMHTGKVLFFAGSGNDPAKLAANDFRSVVWDYENGGFFPPPTPIDLFCSGHSFLPDGRLLVAGGTKQYDTPFEGLKDAYLFDPTLEQWIRVQDMADGRWYPSLVSLGDGRVVAISGVNLTGGNNRVPEIYSNTSNWIALPASGGDWPLYPHLFLLRDGTLFYSGGNMGGILTPLKLKVACNTVATNVPGLRVPNNRNQAASVLLPPARNQRVMIMGGGDPATDAVDIVDLSGASPSYVAAAPLQFARMHLNAVLLPDRTVFVSGGSSMGENVMTAVRQSEIYDPAAGTWKMGATATVPRLYHSVALLLPDGRVITAGSNPDRTNDELRLELFHPPYLFKGPRPFIAEAPQEVSYGATIEIETPQAGEIKWAQLIRPMATTHSSDSSQRLVDLPIKRRHFCKLEVELPREANLAPPGWYMLFITNEHKIPSVAKWVHLAMDKKLRTITTIEIHPGIGVARVGNSRGEFFIGPERRGEQALPPGGYKDAQGRIKRQAARFRLFGYDAQGALVQEITSDDATITWTAHLANKKGEWKQFDGLNPKAPRRNKHVKDRKTLIIDPGARTVTGPAQRAEFDTGKFLGKAVPLGEIRTDEQGRLLVLGGFGHSASPVDAPLTTFANNDKWHDDVSDGPVSAAITLNGSLQAIPAADSWVMVGPPKYAPAIENVITLYDVLLQEAVDKLGLKLPAQPSFTQDIFPLLQRAMRMKWVSGMVAHPQMHAEQRAPEHEMHDGDVEGPAHATLAGVIPPPASASARAAIFEKLRDPALPPSQSSGEADMPMIHSDFYPAEVNQPLTRIQYHMMKQWKDGDFINDWPGPPEVSQPITPEELDRAALDSCVGGAFYPGIEASWFLRDVYKFSKPFRLDASRLKAGDVTKQMAVPWQADFTDCAQEGELAWWPAQRPDDVFPEGGGPQVPWTREIVNSMSDMVHKWHRLGFVVEKGDKYVETERNP